VANGVQPDLETMGNRIVFLANTGWYLYNFRRDLINRCRSHSDQVFLVCPKDQYSEQLKKIGYPVFYLQLSRHPIKALEELLTLHRLYKIIKSIRPTVFHSFTLRCTFLAALTNILARTPVRVYSLTGMGYLFSRSEPLHHAIAKVALFTLKQLMRFGSNRIIVQNSEDYRLVSDRLKMQADCLHLILGSGVDTEHFCPLTNTGSSPRDRVNVLMPTRLLRDKGVFEFVEASQIVNKINPNIHFWLAGDVDLGNPSAISRELIEQWSQYSNLTFLGHQEDMLRLYHKSDIVVLPSYREGLPRCLIEASACGLPMIATDVPGCNEVIIDGKNGYLVSPKNAQQIADRVCQLADAPILRQEMGKFSRERAVDLFNEKTINNQTIALYAESHRFR